ncbi:hypothetical protein T11_2354 [Trichinella zimbabwensis]|uniref:Uncharacterized protein n=1 Tax=Trichinella zimbabwensis TaxID=268475 RepID=A0A0V1F2U4_9BILA|nr:hypothetical protein T11_2354 [Trichinella zimbabwensis]
MPPKHGIQRVISLNSYFTENYAEYDKNDNSNVNRA